MSAKFLSKQTMIEVRALTCAFGIIGLATMAKFAQVLLILQVRVKTMSVFKWNKSKGEKMWDNKMAGKDRGKQERSGFF